MTTSIPGSEETGGAGLEGATLGSGALDETVAAREREPRIDAEALEHGSMVGRYVVTTQIGAGAMGVVYAAYDPELDRKIALKVVRWSSPGEDVEGRSGGRTRLLREAQALAKLSHPNIVAIHDVGTLHGDVWLAMEYVDGSTLTSWLRDGTRRWSDVLAVLLDVGDGLAAAHAAGIVHGDLKPDNVMIGKDGRVRILDFGLARASHAAASEPAPTGRPEALVLDQALVTRTGAVMGTPAYMAAEQFQGERADARADQFAYCITLWESLYGERPFRGQTLAELTIAVLEGRLEMPTKNRLGVPLWLRRVAQRGLEADPERRWPSIDALLDAMRRGRARARRLRVLGALGGLVVIVFAGLVWQQWARARQVVACHREAIEIADVWSDRAKVGLRDALASPGASKGETTFDKLEPWIDRWTTEWSGLRTAACVEGEIEKAIAPELYARQVACLEERRDELAALLEVLSEADAVAARQAVPAVAGLPQLRPCLDATALARRHDPPSDPEAAVRLEELRRTLRRGRGLEAAGRYAEALDQAESVLERAIAQGYPPLVAEARAAVGRAARHLDKLEQSEAALVQAFEDAGAIGEDEVAAAVAVELVFVVGRSAARHEEGLAWASVARMLVRRLGQTEELRGADLLNAVGGVQHGRGDYGAAMQMYEGALAIREAVLGPEHPLVASSLNNLAVAKKALGDVEHALALHERVITIRENVLGRDHPDVANSLGNLAVLLRSRGDEERALALHERALAIRETALGAEHPTVATSLNSIALIRADRGDHDGARALHERSLAIVENAFGAEHPRVADPLNNLAELAREEGDFETAEALYRRAVATIEKVFGPDHIDLAPALHNLAIVHHARGDDDQARALYQRVVTLFENALGPEHPKLAYPLFGLGELALSRDRPAEAIEPLERALALRQNVAAAPDVLPRTQVALARALWAAPAERGRDRPRARELVTSAAEALRAAGIAYATVLAEVEAWLEAHPAARAR